MLNAVELIMYDLDGTLVHSVPDLAIAADNTRQDMGMTPIGVERINLFIGNGVPKMIQRTLTDSMDGVVDAATFVKAQDIFHHHYHSVLGKYSSIYDGVVPFLKEMKARGMVQVVVTNKSEEFTQRLLELMGIAEYFDLVIGGDTLPECKPHPLQLQHALKHFNMPKARALMIGDSVNDVLAAQAASVPVVGLTYGYNHGVPIAESNPDKVVDSLLELL